MPAATPPTRFDIPNALRFEQAPNGLARAVISTSAAEAEIYLHGAHVTHWKPAGAEPVLFVSSRSLFEPGKAIRGGVPIIFPWFGPRGDGKPGPMHGFARTAEWQVEETAFRNGSVEIAFGLAPDAASSALGYDAFQLRFRVAVGAELRLELEVRSLAPEPFLFEEALHTYFAIGDIQQVSVSGLEGAGYVDKTDGFQHKTQAVAPLRIAGETDRVYLNTAAACVIHDPLWNRRIVVEKSGSNATVVWNPWIEKTKTLSDMAPGDWKQMLCVETVNALDNAVHLAPGAAHAMTASIRLE